MSDLAAFLFSDEWPATTAPWSFPIFQESGMVIVIVIVIVIVNNSIAAGSERRILVPLSKHRSES
jgi:hypothetical protein